MIYAIKGDPEGPDMLSSLRNGEGRFGWSSCPTGDLRQLKQKIDTVGWEAGLSEDEKDSYQSFLLDLTEDDYVVYVNVPEWGQCTLARVTGAYVWRFEDEDFNHRFPVDGNSVAVFDRNDEIVHPALSARLKLQGRYWRIYLEQEFRDLLASLENGSKPSPRTQAVNRAFLAKELQPLLVQVTQRIHHTHPNTDLEKLLAEVFRNVPGVKEVKLQGGAGDRGADLIIIFESGIPVPGLQKQTTCVIQAKSFEGEHWDITAANDIRRAFDHYPDADMGLIVSTASVGSEALE